MKSEAAKLNERVASTGSTARKTLNKVPEPIYTF